VGIIIHAKVGSRVSKGEIVLSLDHREQELSPQKKARLESCINISSSATEVPQRLIEVIE
jgi:thymidine phosphorylase